jgi:hypothetical protein
MLSTAGPPCHSWLNHTIVKCISVDVVCFQHSLCQELLAISLYKCVPGSIEAPHVGHGGPAVDNIFYDDRHGNCV